MHSIRKCLPLASISNNERARTCSRPSAKAATWLKVKARAGAYPALANNPRLSADAYPVFMVAQGQGGMPAFKSFLDDEQIAAVVTYIRTHNGNAFNEPVNMATVKALTGR
jgi:mono/diheme cytochrome c family protein